MVKQRKNLQSSSSVIVSHLANFRLFAIILIKFLFSSKENPLMLTLLKNSLEVSEVLAHSNNVCKCSSRFCEYIPIPIPNISFSGSKLNLVCPAKVFQQSS